MQRNAIIEKKQTKKIIFINSNIKYLYLLITNSDIIIIAGKTLLKR